jgi:hypothetical protein
MTQYAPLSPVNLYRVLTRLFDDEELRTLCFELGEDYDYDNLRGEGKKAKARELVALAERKGHLTELEATIRRERPTLATTYSYKRVRELQDSILAASQPDIRDAFIEFTQQIEVYLYKFNLLHEQLEEWKEVHNLLQDLQFSFTSCRSYLFVLSRLAGSTRSAHAQRERALYEVEIEWRSCKRCLHRLQQLARSIQVIGLPYDHESGSGPDWFLIPWEIAGEIDKALFDDDVAALAEQLSAFGYRVDQLLYQADKALRVVVSKINLLPRPGSYVVRS